MFVQGNRSCLVKDRTQLGHPEWSFHSWQEVGRASELWELGWHGLERSQVAQEGDEPALPKWPWVHLPAPTIPGRIIPWSPLPCTAQDPFWPYQRPMPTKVSLAKLKRLCFLIVKAHFELSTPFSTYSPLQLFKLCSHKTKTSQTFPCMPFHWAEMYCLTLLFAMGPFTLFKGCQSGVNLSIDLPFTSHPLLDALGSCSTTGTEE